MSKAAELNAQLGAEYLNQGRYKLAKIKLEKSLDQNSRLPQAHATYAWLQFLLGEQKLAEKHFKIALRGAPEDSGVINNYGAFLCRQGKYSEAEQYFRKAASDPLYATPEYALDNAGTCAMDSNRLKEARVYLNRALDANPKFANALLHLSQLYDRQGEYGQAWSYYQRYEEYGVKNPVSLALGIKLASIMDEDDKASSYRLLLKNRYPESEQAQAL